MSKQNSSLQTILVNIGLTNKEADIYLSLLELGKGTVSNIAQKAGINRTTGYDILNSLATKGLVSTSGKEPKQEYIAESPDKIISLLQKKIKTDQEKMKKAQQLIPQLKSIHNVSERPKVRFYEGKEGLIQIYEDTLTAQGAIRAFANINDMHKTLPDYFSSYYKRRVKKGIKIRGIVPNTEIARERVKHNKEESRETVLLPADKFYFSPEINIYNNKVMIASWREKLGIIIESAEIADAMKKIYELAWSEAKRLSET